MREEDLRRILLVAAVEDADRDGTVLPPADRENAAREARRSAGASADAAALLAHRAAALHARVVERHPFVADVERHAGGIAGVGLAILVAGLLAGFALSALDGTRRVNVLAYPLAGLVAWNLAVYVFTAVRALRPAATPRRGWLAESTAALGARRLAAFVARSRAFHATLAEALGKFAVDWSSAARPVLAARAARLFHLAAAMVGVGLVAGLYLRGIAFDYRAGWESTFLDAAGARTVAAVLYAPASWITGLAIPDAAHFEAIRWRDGAGGGGEPAARWLHLIAASALVWVVIPRLLLAIAAGFGAARAARSLALPPQAQARARSTFGALGLAPGSVRVVPYAYEPDGAARARIGRALERELGQGLSLDQGAAVAYGEEERALAGFSSSEPPAAAVVVMNLASTPEDENHGRFLEGLRDTLQRARAEVPLLVLVDEGPYLARMGGGARVDERRRAWEAFVGARGLRPAFVDLRT
jgi:hypothetical protein